MLGLYGKGVVYLDLKTASAPYILRQGWPKWQAKLMCFIASPSLENGSHCRSRAPKECASFAGVVWDGLMTFIVTIKFV